MKKFVSIILSAIFLITYPTVTSTIAEEDSINPLSKPGQNL